MLSAVIVASDARVRVSASAEAVVRTLASLVPAAIDGLIRDVTLATLLDAPQAREIADHAGCALAQAQTNEGVLAAGIASARCEWIFLIRAGHAPEAGFIEEVADLYAVAPARAAILRAAPETWLARLFPMLGAVEGLIVRKGDVGAGVADIKAIRGSLASPRLLRCRLRRVV